MYISIPNYYVNSKNMGIHGIGQNIFKMRSAENGTKLNEKFQNSVYNALYSPYI